MRNYFVFFHVFIVVDLEKGMPRTLTAERVLVLHRFISKERKAQLFCINTSLDRHVMLRLCVLVLLISVLLFQVRANVELANFQHLRCPETSEEAVGGKKASETERAAAQLSRDW